MHIEIDVLEIMTLISLFFVIKWACRVVVLILVAKVIGNVVKRGKDSIAEIKNGFKEFSGVESDAREDK